jgi:hypothetical protein
MRRSLKRDDSRGKSIERMGTIDQTWPESDRHPQRRFRSGAARSEIRAQPSRQGVARDVFGHLSRYESLGKCVGCYGYAENPERMCSVSIPGALDSIVVRSPEFLTGGLLRFTPACQTFNADVASCVAVRSSLSMPPLREVRARIASSAASTRSLNFSRSSSRSAARYSSGQ